MVGLRAAGKQAGLAALGVIWASVVSGCGTECVDCPGPEIFAFSVIQDQAVVGGVIWLPQSEGVWSVGGVDLDVVESTPSRQIVQVPADLEAGSVLFESESESLEVRLIDPEDLGPQAPSLHDAVFDVSMRRTPRGRCQPGCSTIPSLELPRPPVPPEEQEFSVGLRVSYRPPPNDGSSNVIVDVWDDGVDVSDSNAPRIIDSALVLFSQGTANVVARSNARAVQVRFRSPVDPTALGDVIRVVADE